MDTCYKELASKNLHDKNGMFSASEQVTLLSWSFFMTGVMSHTHLGLHPFQQHGSHQEPVGQADTGDGSGGSLQADGEGQSAGYGEDTGEPEEEHRR